MGASKLASHGRRHIVCEQVVQEDGATPTDVAEPVCDSTEVYKTLRESVSVEQGQPLRATEPDQCVLKVKTLRQRDTDEFTHSLLDVNGEAR